MNDLRKAAHTALDELQAAFGSEGQYTVQLRAIYEYIQTLEAENVPPQAKLLSSTEDIDDSEEGVIIGPSSNGSI